jgi:hypothetical protein
MKKQFVIFLLIIFSTLFFTKNTLATSGACSSHGGVNCGLGRQYDGRVYCVDGWVDSETYYSFTQKCINESTAPFCTTEEYNDLLIKYDIEKLENEIDELLSTTRIGSAKLEEQHFGIPLSLLRGQQAKLEEQALLESLYLEDKLKLQLNKVNSECSVLGVNRMFEEKHKTSCSSSGYIYRNDQCITPTQDCQSYYGNYAYGITNTDGGSTCYCSDGYVWNQNQTTCILNTPICSALINGYLGSDGQCYCSLGYSWSNTTNNCTQNIIETVVVKSDSIEIKNDNVIEEEKSLITKLDKKIAKRMSGGILLQVEKNGEGWYVSPGDQKKYYLGRPTDAFDIMRKLGLGVKHDFIATNATFPDRVLGKILIDVEDNGKAYYIYPKDKKAYYLGRPEDAFKVMRELGLGITNSDIRKIEVGEVE